MTDKYANPWKTLSTQIVYENPWIRVREDQVLRPDGQPGIYGVIEYHGCVGVLPIDADGNVHLVGQFRYVLNQYSWEIPEGGCHVGEDPFTAAQRELREELGLEAGKLELLGRSHLSNSVSDEEAFYYVATDLVQGEAAPEGTEQLERRIVTFDEALQMVLNSEITDSLSQIAILHYAALKNKQ
ncbi:MAG: NUDIX hydrolase [Acidobacteria bacterium]|nr:NUDIX hydrolase [Acidobacteriota bacterium]